MNELARRYAQACFNLHFDPKRFSDTAKSISECLPLREAMENPSLDFSEKERVLDRLQLFEGAPELLGFYKLLVRKGRMKLLPEITEAFRSIDLESRNTAVCEMLCAHFPDAERQARIRETLCRLHHRDEILLDIKTDPELLGGFILKIDNVTYDRSVRRSLRDMARYLQERRII